MAATIELTERQMEGCKVMAEATADAIRKAIAKLPEDATAEDAHAKMVELLMKREIATAKSNAKMREQYAAMEKRAKEAEAAVAELQEAVAGWQRMAEEARELHASALKAAESFKAKAEKKAPRAAAGGGAAKARKAPVPKTEKKGDALLADILEDGEELIVRCAKAAEGTYTGTYKLEERVISVCDWGENKDYKSLSTFAGEALMVAAGKDKKVAINGWDAVYVIREGEKIFLSTLRNKWIEEHSEAGSVEESD